MIHGCLLSCSSAGLRSAIHHGCMSGISPFHELNIATLDRNMPCKLKYMPHLNPDPLPEVFFSIRGSLYVEVRIEQLHGQTR